MILQKIQQWCSLKLEHHPFGRNIILLLIPFYVRPHHYRKKELFIATRLGYTIPFAPAIAFTALIDRGIDFAQLEYAKVNLAISWEMLKKFQELHNTVPLVLGTGAFIAIYVIAAFSFIYNLSLCKLWAKLSFQVDPAPYAFYLGRTSSLALWLCGLTFLLSKVASYGIARSLEIVTTTIQNHPLVTIFVVLLYWGIDQIRARNTHSSAMEIYGNQCIVLIRRFQLRSAARVIL
jgi:hypothetical protein